MVTKVNTGLKLPVQIPLHQFLWRSVFYTIVYFNIILHKQIQCLLTHSTGNDDMNAHFSQEPGINAGLVYGRAYKFFINNFIIFNIYNSKFFAMSEMSCKLFVQCWDVNFQILTHFIFLLFYCFLTFKFTAFTMTKSSGMVY